MAIQIQLSPDIFQVAAFSVSVFFNLFVAAEPYTSV